MDDEPIEVILTLLGSRRSAGAEFDQPRVDRHQVRLQVSPDDRLSEVLARAATEFDIRAHQMSIAFHDPKRNAISHSAGTVTLVDRSGHATWMYAFDEVTYRQLIESAEAGVLAGDPRRPYIDTTPGMGNGTVPDWETIKAIWDALDVVLTAIGAAGMVNEARRRLTARLRRKAQGAAQVIEHHASDWEGRRGDPYALRQWLDDRVWSSADLASALGCTEPEAEAVLWSFGFEHSPSCVWRRGADEESKFLGEVHGLGYAVTGASRAQVHQVLETHARTFLESGQAPTIGWEDLDWLHPSRVIRTVARAKRRAARLRRRFRRIRS